MENSLPTSAKDRALVLIVEDDLGLRLDCREVFEDAGFSVADAGDGRKALSRLADEAEPPPVLILLDLSMPFMDGWDFMEVLRREPRLADIPVVLVSAYQPDPAIEASVSAFLRKPVDPSQLLRVVSALIESRPAKRPSSDDVPTSSRP